MVLFVSCAAGPSLEKINVTKKGLQSKATRDHESIANEIITIQQLSMVVLCLVNNTNVHEFSKMMAYLSTSLVKIERELDTLGPLPASLREVTLRSQEERFKSLEPLLELRNAQGPLNLELQKLFTPFMEDYFQNSLSVVLKAGLTVKATNGARGTVDAPRQR